MNYQIKSEILKIKPDITIAKRFIAKPDLLVLLPLTIIPIIGFILYQSLFNNKS